MPLPNGHRSEIDAVGHVADRIDILSARARVFIDCDAAILGELHACCLQADFGDVRRTPDCEHDTVCGNLVAATEMRRKMGMPALDRRHLATGNNPDAALLQLGPQMCAYVIVKPAKNIFAAINDRHLRPEASEDASKFNCGITAALNQHAMGQLR